MRGSCRSIAATFAVISSLTVSAVGQVAPQASPTSVDKGGAERLVFLLQYVGSDYAAAVQGGKVIDEAEYRENREFTAMIGEQFARLRPAVPATKLPPLDDAIAKLQALVAAHADAALVRAVTEAAIPRLVAVFDLRSFPRERPDPLEASRLYAENCTPCHGPSGGGDGPRAKELDPPPARFTDPVRMSGTAPYLFYNAITFGVANTAMASFADGLADQQRWDLAFFLWNFVLPPERRIPRGDVVLALRELATRASSDLAPEVVRQAAAQGETIDAAEAMVRVAQLRAYPPLLSDPQERLARLRQDLARSLALIDRNDTDAAADVVTTAYLTEFEPLEPEIDRRDSRIRQRFERGLIDFRGALRRNDRTAALATAKALTDTVDRAAELLGEDRGARTASRRLLYGGFTVAAFAIVVLTVWRIGKARAVR